MAVQQEIKSQLAKLLATEDLVVEHKNVTTAQFNVHTRVLTLPLWEKASNVVYDMLVGHEVGHALFTPDIDWTLDVRVPSQFINVVEDARIEKLMKRKYRGLAKTFYHGYKQLHKDDFFELNDEDITTFNLADRANLYFKVGSFLSLAFSSAEKQIIAMIEGCETFEDTKKVALVLYQYCLEKQKKQEKEKPEKKEELRQEIEFEDHPLLEDEEMPPPSDTITEELEVRTEESLRDKIKDLVNQDAIENVYIELPELNLDTVIATNKDIHHHIDNYFAYQQEESDGDIFECVDADFIKFKRDSQREVSYLVKEFECKKAADAYARSSTSKTGVLDTAHLHSYKFNEQLFKKVTTLPDGKNHGLVFLLDWSGSMQYVLQDTIKQLYNLIWFCKKVSIPFEVYAFTNDCRRIDIDFKTGEHIPVDRTPHYKKREGVFYIDDDFNLMNLLTSRVSSKQLEHQMRNIWRSIAPFSQFVGYSYPPRLVLSGTPLNEALISLHKILPQFQKENKIQKVQCIILTDGEANHLPYHTTVRRRWESRPYLGCRNVHPERCFLRDRKLGKTYKFGYQWYQFTEVFLKNLKDTFPDVNLIGIRVLQPRDAKSFIKIYYPFGNQSIERDWKKLRSFVIKRAAYDAYFGMSSTTLSQDSEFEVEEDATKSQIKKAFVKSLQTKKLNKKVLSEFISLVV